MGMMKRLAVGLIGLLAGAVLRVADLRQRHRAILWILALQGAAVLLAVWGAALLGRQWIPFLDGLAPEPLIFVSLLFAATLTVNSPMVTLASDGDPGRRAAGRTSWASCWWRTWRSS
jgi:hypothetical protein